MPASDTSIFVAVPDTNTLFDRDIRNIVSPGFNKLYNQLRTNHKLRLHVPEIVRDELIFRQVHAAKKSLENARKSLGHISEITGTRIQKLRSDRDITAKVRKTFHQWMERHDAKIIKTPIARIKWKAMIENAVWRLPPFELTEDQGVPIEKGFRDALIIETVRHFGAACGGDTLVFLSNDNRVREAFTAFPKTSERRLLFNSLKDFGSYLNVIEDNRTKEFSQKVIANAKNSFFSGNNPNCAYYHLKVPDLTEQRFGILMQYPPNKMVSAFTLGASQFGTNVFSQKPISEQKSFIYDTYFDSASGNRYKWRTRVEVVQLFTTDSSYSGATFSERIRVTELDVLWSSKVSEQAHISDVALIDIQMVRNELDFVNFDQKMRYGFPLIGPSHFPTNVTLPPQGK